MVETTVLLSYKHDVNNNLPVEDHIKEFRVFSNVKTGFTAVLFVASILHTQATYSPSTIQKL